MEKKPIHFRSILIACLCFALFLTLTFVFRYKIHIPLKLAGKSDLTKPLKGTMRCTFISTVQDSHCLRMQVAVPYKDRKHWIEIKNALPRIKNEFIIAINQEGMDSILRERNFKAMRSLLKKTFNKNLKRPVDTIYFESFFYN